MSNYYLTVYYHEKDDNGNEYGILREYNCTCFCLDETLGVVRRLSPKWAVTDIKISIR